jgi:hypothetical protein
VPMIAHASVPAANQGYRFRYANTRQTVFIHHKFTRSTQSRESVRALNR